MLFLVLATLIRISFVVFERALDEWHKCFSSRYDSTRCCTAPYITHMLELNAPMAMNMPNNAWRGLKCRKNSRGNIFRAELLLQCISFLFLSICSGFFYHEYSFHLVQTCYSSVGIHSVWVMYTDCRYMCVCVFMNFQRFSKCSDVCHGIDE